MNTSMLENTRIPSVTSNHDSNACVHEVTCQQFQTAEDGWIKTTYISMQTGAVWDKGDLLIHLCI